MGDSGLDVSYSRKDKSLGLLCEAFLRMYGQGDNGMITLDGTAAVLKVERRRVYDIVNVLESVEIVERQHKNVYKWLGLESLPGTLARIEREDLSYSGRSAIGRGGERREKSLGLLSQRFIQMFLQAPNDKVLALEAAAETLLDAEGSAHDVNKLKTKVRRLYDIANILSSLQLLEKTQLPDSRKPAFRWLGIEERIAAAPTATLKDFYSNQKTLAQAARLAAAQRGAGSCQEGAQQLGGSIVKRSARSIPTGPRAKRERRPAPMAFGLASARTSLQDRAEQFDQSRPPRSSEQRRGDLFRAQSAETDGSFSEGSPDSEDCTPAAREMDDFGSARSRQRGEHMTAAAERQDSRAYGGTAEESLYGEAAALEPFPRAQPNWESQQSRVGQRSSVTHSSATAQAKNDWQQRWQEQRVDQLQAAPGACKYDNAAQPHEIQPSLGSAASITTVLPAPDWNIAAVAAATAAQSLPFTLQYSGVASQGFLGMPSQGHSLGSQGFSGAHTQGLGEQQQLGGFPYLPPITQQQYKAVSSGIQVALQAAHPVLSHMPAQLQGSTTSAVDASKSLLQGAVINQLLSNYMQLCGMPQGNAGQYSSGMMSEQMRQGLAGGALASTHPPCLYAGTQHGDGYSRANDLLNSNDAPTLRGAPVTAKAAPSMLGVLTSHAESGPASRLAPSGQQCLGR